jgi:hypothetical protein
MSLIRPSTEYPSLLLRHILLLQQWGPERRNDIQVSVYELLRYRLAEILLLHQHGRSGQARTQMANYMTTLMTNLGFLGTKTTLVAPVMVFTRDALNALGLLSAFLDTLYQVVLWAARFRHRLLPYILSVLVDAAAVSPNPSDRGRVADMCAELLVDESLQLVAQITSEYREDNEEGSRHHERQQQLASSSMAESAAAATATELSPRKPPGHHSDGAALLRQFPVSPRARHVFTQMHRRAALVDFCHGSSTRPPAMNYPDW